MEDGMDTSEASPGRTSISWGSGNRLHVSFVQNAGSQEVSRVVGVQLGGKLDAEARRLAYGSLPAFSLLQNQRQTLLSSQDNLPADWWEQVLEYSRCISVLLEDVVPLTLKGVWDFIELFYVDRGAASWLPERLADWLMNYDKVLSTESSTVHLKIASLEQNVLNVQFPENESEYWAGMVSALSVGWLDVATTFLRMHGSYRPDQIDDRQTENGLVEAVTLLISKMPRLRPRLPDGFPGVACSFKPDFAKAWEKWRSQVAKLENSTFWAECNHAGTLVGLKRMLQVMLGNVDVLTASTYHWMELLVARLLYVSPFSLASDGILTVAEKCKNSKDAADEGLRDLLTAVIGSDTEVLLAECSRHFDAWTMAHVGDLLTAKSSYALSLLQEERASLGGISLLELHRLAYAQVLSSHSLTWQLAPVYLASCPKQGLVMLENVLLKQRVSASDKLTLKALEICRLYELGSVEVAISRAAGIHRLKHGKTGAGVLWLQRANDEQRLAAVADQILKAVSSGAEDNLDNLQHLEGLLDLLGSGATSVEGLSFLNRYKEFKTALHSVRKMHRKDYNSENMTNVGRAAVTCLLQLLTSGTIPRRFWISLLQDSVELLEWPKQVLVTESETFTLQRSLQELFLSRDRGDEDVLLSLERAESALPVERIRLALASNLGRAMLQC